MRVMWSIDIETTTNIREAAEQALEIMRNPNSVATVFDVENEEGSTWRVDLEEADDQGEEIPWEQLRSLP